MSKETFKKQLVDYLMDENLDTLTRIGVLEKNFRKFWDTDEEEDSFDKLEKLSRIWGDELKEQWGKFSLIMKLFKDFNLDEGRNSQMFKESKVGGDCYYWVDNYEVKIDDRSLSNRYYQPMGEVGFENL